MQFSFVEVQPLAAIAHGTTKPFSHEQSLAAITQQLPRQSPFVKARATLALVTMVHHRVFS